MERLRTAKRPAPDPHQIEVVDWAVIATLGSTSGSQRVAMGFDLLDFARDVIAMGVRHQHPDWDAPQVAHEVAKRLARDAA
ncbi:MAG: hypothetical protein IT436_09565 [Phycisphaerales bacterium]|nr:hypothetical protein [Phycisphaerales bacterium]